MSVFLDVYEMYRNFNFPIPDHPTLIDKEQMAQRLDFIMEELNETADAVSQENLDEVIDGLVDLMVVAAGTLVLMGVRGQLHWNEVQRANLEKVRSLGSEAGTGRMMRFDLRKPKGWKKPDHKKVRETMYGD